jgi:uncharacterized protein (TIGR02996 family)
MNEESLLRGILDNPGEPSGWLVLADWLEEHGDARAELVRLQHDPNFRRGLKGAKRDARVRELLTSGVRPCVPELVNSVGMRFVLVPAGTFRMGSPAGEAEREQVEGPQREVEITRPFLLGAYLVTQEEFGKVMGHNPSWYSADGICKDNVSGLDTRRFPVSHVSWEDVARFCKKLSARPKEKKAGRAYRLPTEAEWEYACRGGAKSHTAFSCGPSLSSTQANFDGRQPYGGAPRWPYLGRPTEVGSYRPNAWGLYDMHGNVWEWCADWWSVNNKKGPRRDPKGPEKGEYRVMRGGCFHNPGHYCRTAFRYAIVPRDPNHNVGFRVVCEVDGG